MPTHDYIIANGTGAAVRADINAALSAIVSLNSSASEPGTMYAYQLWADTTSNLLKIRNSANSAWITLRQLDGDFSIVAVEDGLQATPSLTFTNDLNTGIFRPGNDSLSIVTNALRAITITSTQAVGIQTANPSTALHVAGNARVGADDTTDAHLQIGKGATGNRNSYIDIVGDTTYTDYGVRVIRNNGGADATSEIKHRGTGAFNIVTQEAAPIEFYTTNSPRVAIDSSGRLLVGTSSVSVSSTIVCQGNSGSSSGEGIVRLNRGTAVPTSGQTLGAIIFGQSACNDGAYILGEADAAWSASNDYPTRLVFSTTADGAASPTERMRITKEGASRFFCSTGADTIDVASAEAAGTSRYLLLGAHSATGTGTGTNCYRVYTNGNVQNTNNSYTGISDIKLKENIVDANSQWDDIKALQVRNYNFKEGQTHRQIGLIAQEVEPISPGLVYETPDRDADGNDLGTTTKAVQYSVLYMKAVKALQEAMERIEQLEQRLTDAGIN